MKKNKEESFFSDEREEALEDSEYSIKGDFSKAELIQKQISKCFDLRSRDMRPGYTTFINGKPEVIPDSRKEFVGSVEVLKGALAPELDKKNPEIHEQWEEAKKELFDKYAYRERIGKEFVKTPTGEIATWKYSGRIFLPQKGAKIMCNNEKPLSVGFVYAALWDNNIDAYWDTMVEYADELFQELNRLIHELDYFKGTSAW